MEAQWLPSYPGRGGTLLPPDRPKTTTHREENTQENGAEDAADLMTNRLRGEDGQYIGSAQ